MEPEWNNPTELDDATMLGLRQNLDWTANKFINMHFGWMKDRLWGLRFSLNRRKCYISGDDLQFKFAYRGRKPIKSIVSSNKFIYDDIWISQKCYLNLITSGKIMD